MHTFPEGALTGFAQIPIIGDRPKPPSEHRPTPAALYPQPCMHCDPEALLLPPRALNTITVAKTSGPGAELPECISGCSTLGSYFDSRRFLT